MSAPGDPVLLGALVAEVGASASAGLVLALAARPWRGRGEPTPAWSAPLALAAGAAAGFWLTRGRPSFPPTQAVHWLFYAALAGGACGAFEAARGKSVALRGLLAALLPVLVLAFQRERYWARVEGVLWTAGLAALLFVTWNVLAAAEGHGGGTRALGLACATALAAGSYALAGGALFAQFTGALALAMGLCALLGLWRRAPGLGPGGIAPYVLLHHGMLWCARWVNELSLPAFVLLALAPLAVLAARLAPSSRPRLAAALAFLGPMLLSAAALGWEFASQPAADAYY